MIFLNDAEKEEKAMVRVDKVRDTNSLGHIVCDLQVSTVSDLNGFDTVDGRTVLPGSIAQVIQTGEWYTLDEDGTWYISGGGS